MAIKKGKKEVKKETGLCLTNRKNDNFGEWYYELVVGGEMISYTDISDCYVVEPWAMEVWNIMKVSREFMWQEGHTVFATESEAGEEILEVLELYRRIYEEYLAVPVIKGKKSELEKFAGGLYTTSVEAFIPNTGRGVQGATSHCLGQNFAKIFHIVFEDENRELAT
ncbi:hypothetical protein ZOSMA_158G00140 [Zostera marina]|uniref:Aminoacyl-tRNA synthetase class II (G/ P/ S/T) domain-containing protein n=1 Tax=Zostera marina TaxID=29655 RepID=A0A0K9PVD6_ZOSMR|nr:hypothetical protein ZOSMA_158G00140 [Zostera marina]